MDTRPNIIFIMTDQQRYDAVGKRNPNVITPAIDRLIEEGVLFSEATAPCPMCVPCRNSMMFGLYPSQTGVRTNSGCMLDESRLPGIPLPQILKDAGYFTAGFGKTHWNHTQKGVPGSRRGFDVRAEGQPRNSVLVEEGAVMMDDEDPDGLAAYFSETRAFGSGEENALGYIGMTSALDIESHRDGFISKKCLEFIKSYEKGEKPLFLYLSFIKPHAGFNIPKQFEDMYDIDAIPDLPQPPWDQEPDTHIRAQMDVCESLHTRHYELKEVWEKLSPVQRKKTTLRYWANCTFMDYLIGQNLDAMRKNGILDNALIVFVSDHGDMMGERDHRFSKYCLFESSVRVPLVLSGSYLDKALRGTRDERPASLIDIVPTLRNAASLAPDPRLSGLDLLSGRMRTGAFSEFHGGGADRNQPAPAWMWRTKEYKLILYREGPVFEDGEIKGELYDLINDPNEWTNLFYDEKYIKIRLKLTEEMLAHAASAFARAPMMGDYKGHSPITPK
ncbi:MAG: sulfatase-like hydrolase/transferase [Clostridia bacterium]|nr:sulfatase-like hydrolase/transferase [Clostridia bacterium]MBQ4158188.1 sulfatase-like hydrolase/transferase [Clostridia bacterium]